MFQFRQNALQLSDHYSRGQLPDLPRNERLELAEALLGSLDDSEILLYTWQRSVIDERLDALAQRFEEALGEDVEKRARSTEI